MSALSFLSEIVLLPFLVAYLLAASVALVLSFRDGAEQRPERSDGR